MRKRCMTLSPRRDLLIPEAWRSVADDALPPRRLASYSTPTFLARNRNVVYFSPNARAALVCWPSKIRSVCS